jgi:hypothetical protein
MEVRQKDENELMSVITAQEVRMSMQGVACKVVGNRGECATSVVRVMP